MVHSHSMSYDDRWVTICLFHRYSLRINNRDYSLYCTCIYGDSVRYGRRTSCREQSGVIPLVFNFLVFGWEIETIPDPSFENSFRVTSQQEPHPS